MDAVLAFGIEIVVAAAWARWILLLWRRRDFRSTLLISVLYVGALSTFVVELANEVVIKGTYYPNSLLRLPGLDIPVAVIIAGSLYCGACTWVLLALSRPAEALSAWL